MSHKAWRRLQEEAATREAQERGDATYSAMPDYIMSTDCTHDWVRDDHFHRNIVLAPGTKDFTCAKCGAHKTEAG